jgi:hypothetical protein
MEDAKRMNGILEASAWGLLSVWWGLSLLPHLLPNGLDAADTGLILIGLNVVRSVKKIPISGFSTTCGILCLIWGGLDLSRSVFHLPHRLPVLAILMIALGLILGLAALWRARNTGASES